MINISEYVSPGHPDKIADYISSYILDRYIGQDPNTRYAVEVQIKDSHVTLGGEVSSSHFFSNEELTSYVKEAINEIGYTKEYQDKWGVLNTISADDIDVVCHIGQQSPQIAQGLSGWGDQGIFFGMYNPDNPFGMPEDHHMAKHLCKALFESGLGGLDIKTQVVMHDNSIHKITVAIPTETETESVRLFVKDLIPGEYDLIVNGTGSYIKHGPIADCGTTGRKLAVDFYGGNCLIGGGSPWTKDGSKADLTLNLYARYLARQYALRYSREVFVKLACCIGRREVDVAVMDNAGRIIYDGIQDIDPRETINLFQLDKPIYESMCKWGLFGEGQTDKAWESK